jgi:hypothetical protein
VRGVSRASKDERPPTSDFIAAFDPNHCAGSRFGLENTRTVGFPVQTWVPMISHTHQNLTESTSHGFGRVGGYALIVIIAVLLLVVLLTNPVLPQ